MVSDRSVNVFLPDQVDFFNRVALKANRRLLMRSYSTGSLRFAPNRFCRHAQPYGGDHVALRHSSDFPEQWILRSGFLVILFLGHRNAFIADA
jgi:hypothetical protein